MGSVAPVSGRGYCGRMVAAPSLLDELLAPVCEAFSPEVAARLVALRASSALQTRLDELADGHREGRLSARNVLAAG